MLLILLRRTLLSGDDQPECDVCQYPLTVKHIMIECVDLLDVRNIHFVVSSTKDLFENVASQNIVDFIKETLFISNFNICVLMLVTSFFIIAK